MSPAPDASRAGSAGSSPASYGRSRTSSVTTKSRSLPPVYRVVVGLRELTALGDPPASSSGDRHLDGTVGKSLANRDSTAVLQAQAVERGLLRPSHDGLLSIRSSSHMISSPSEYWSGSRCQRDL